MATYSFLSFFLLSNKSQNLILPCGKIGGVLQPIEHTTSRLGHGGHRRGRHDRGRTILILSFDAVHNMRLRMFWGCIKASDSRSLHNGSLHGKVVKNGAAPRVIALPLLAIKPDEKCLLLLADTDGSLRLSWILRRRNRAGGPRLKMVQPRVTVSLERPLPLLPFSSGGDRLYTVSIGGRNPRPPNIHCWLEYTNFWVDKKMDSTFKKSSPDL